MVLKDMRGLNMFPELQNPSIFSPCLNCPVNCCTIQGNVRVEPRFFPHEVKRGLHLKFNYRVWSIHDVEIVTMDPDKPCPYFKNGLCLVYGTEDMPLDCRIYPAMPSLDGGIVIDYEGCPMAKYFDTPEYKSKVLELLKPHLPLGKMWLRAYWRLEKTNRQWYCPLCNESFPTQSSLRSHFLRSHAASVLRQCLICGVKFGVSGTIHYTRLGLRDPWHAAVYALIPHGRTAKDKLKLRVTASEFLKEPHDLNKLEPIILQNVKPPYLTRHFETSLRV